MSSQAVVRPSRRADCPQLVLLIRQMADTEGVADAPKMDHKTLEVDGFDGPVPWFKCFVAEAASGTAVAQLVGYVLYYYVFSWSGKTVLIEDVYVVQSHIGEELEYRLWNAMLQDVVSEGAVMCKMTTLGCQSSMYSFYCSRGAEDATVTRNFHLYRMPRPRMVAMVNTPVKSTADIVIRKAASADLAAVVDQFGELAVVLAAAQDMNVTKTMMQNGLDEGYCHILVADQPSLKRVVGFAMYGFVYSTYEGRSLYLKNFFVKKESRGDNVGTMLWQAVMEHALSAACCRCDIISSSANVVTNTYYENRGARDITKEQGWRRLHMVLPFTTQSTARPPDKPCHMINNMVT